MRSKFAIAALASFCLPILASAQYSRHNLTSDGFVAADNLDTHLVNPWGISFGPTTPFWIADNGSSVSTLYNGAGAPQALVVNTPAGPTGTVFNGTTDFVVSNGSASGAARFLFADLNGGISGWNSTVDGTHAIKMVDMSASGGVYTGLAIQTGGSGSRLYAANFSRGGVDMFDAAFHYMGSFTDNTVDPGFSPFNVQAIGSSLFVQYAMIGPDGDEIKGAGLGYVDEFDRDGHLLRRVVSRGQLNAPWGVAMAPSNFGQFSNDLLVGNFGDGSISAFDPVTGIFQGRISDSGGQALITPGLWGIAFGNGGSGFSANSLYFTAGIGDEQHGLFGRIDAVPEPASIAAMSLGIAAILRRRKKTQ